MREEQIHMAVHSFLHLARKHRAAIERQVGESGLHGAQHRLLLMLSRCSEMPSQAELARRLDISAPAVVGALAKLEKEGYITRPADATDCRNRKVKIAEKGIQTLEATRARFDAVDSKMFSGFSEEEIERFAAYITRMQKNLSEEEGK